MLLKKVLCEVINYLKTSVAKLGILFKLFKNSVNTCKMYSERRRVEDCTRNIINVEICFEIFKICDSPI